jgi:protein gp37
MSQKSSIEWTDSTWNPVTGCTKVSPGCKNCYAERMAKRLQAMGQQRYVNGFRVTIQKDSLQVPLKWRTPRRVFVNSMSDLFHEDVPFSFIADVLQTIREANWHTFQILTKRAKRLATIAQKLYWPDNLYVGVSVESAEFVGRIRALSKVPTAIRFISFEPLLGPIPQFSSSGIHWVIVGGESGPRARPMAPEWVRAIRDLSVSKGIPFFFKQWGGVRKDRTGRVLDGRTWDEEPWQLKSRSTGRQHYVS